MCIRDRCKCVDVSIGYSANMIEKILDASLKCRNLDIERYSFEQWKQHGSNILKSNEYRKWENVRKLIEDNEIAKKFEKEKVVENIAPIITLPESISDQNFRPMLLNSIANKDVKLYNELKKILDEDESWYVVENGFEIYNELLEIVTKNEVSIEISINKSNDDKTAKNNNVSKVNYKGGDKYEGKLVDGVKTGVGKYTWEDGTIYEGDWVSDKRTGKGKYTFTDGDYNDGIWDNDKFISGKVRNTNSKGYRYLGEYLNNERHGQGILYNPSGEIIENGRFVFGNFENDYIEFKKLVNDFAKTNGFNSTLSNLFNSSKKNNFDEAKTNTERLIKSENYKAVIKECVNYISKDNDFVNLREITYYLLMAAEKINLDDDSYSELLFKSKVIFEDENINAIYVGSIMRLIFSHFSKYTISKTSDGNEYYYIEATETGKPINIIHNSKIYLELYKSFLGRIDRIKSIKYNNVQLKNKIEVTENRINTTLIMIDQHKKFNENRKAQLQNSTDSPTTSKSETNKTKKAETPIIAKSKDYKISYSLKMKSDKNVTESHLWGLLKQTNTVASKGENIKRTLIMKKLDKAPSKSDALHFISTNDKDVVKGYAGSSTIHIDNIVVVN